MAEHADPTGVNGVAVLDPAEDDLDLLVVEPAEEPGDQVEASDETPVAEAKPGRRPSVTGAAMTAGLALVVALGALIGWLGYRDYQDRQFAATQAAVVNAAREGATNLTTIDFTRIDADIARILDSSTGTFHDDFAGRAQPFIEVVKQAQSKSEGTVTSAGLESMEGDLGRVLVAVSVKTSNAGAREQEPRAWRMRIDVKRVDGGFKMSNVQFVP